MKTATVKLPAFLAGALVNGDRSSLHCNCGASPNSPRHCGGCDFEALEAAIAYVAPGRVVGTASQPCDCGALDAPEFEQHAASCGANVDAEPYFSRRNDLPGDCGLTPGQVLDYVVLYPDNARD